MGREDGRRCLQDGMCECKCQPTGRRSLARKGDRPRISRTVRVMNINILFLHRICVLHLFCAVIVGLG